MSLNSSIKNHNWAHNLFEGWQAVIRMNPTDNESVWEIHYQGGSLTSMDGFSKETNAELSLLCLALESIKQKWYDYVFRMRIKHPVLNCFSIQQLKTISHNLAQCKKSQDSIDDDIFYFLRSLNNNLEASEVQKWLYDSYIDKRSQMHSLLKISAEVFAGNDKLAKAAIQATGGSGRDDAVNWAVENDNGEEIIELVQQFDNLFRPSKEIETQNELASQLEIVFDGYLQSLDDNLTNFTNLHLM